MFESLAASLNITFKWLPDPVFHLDQMFDRLATSANKKTPKRKKATNQEPNLCYVTAYCRNKDGDKRTTRIRVMMKWES